MKKGNIGKLIFLGIAGLCIKGGGITSEAKISSLNESTKLLFDLGAFTTVQQITTNNTEVNYKNGRDVWVRAIKNNSDKHKRFRKFRRIK